MSLSLSVQNVSLSFFVQMNVGFSQDGTLKLMGESHAHSLVTLHEAHAPKRVCGRKAHDRIPDVDVLQRGESRVKRGGGG